MLVALGQKAPELPAGFEAAHNKETAGVDDPAKFATKAEYLRLMDEMKAASLAAVEATSESGLDAPGPEPMRARMPTVGVGADDVGLALAGPRRPTGAHPPQARQAGAVLSVWDERKTGFRWKGGCRIETGWSLKFI